MSLCLSRDELAELTRTRVKIGQVKFLARNGIRHYVEANSHQGVGFGGTHATALLTYSPSNILASPFLSQS